MVKGMGRTQKIVKQNRRWPVVTNGNFKITLLATYFHDTSNRKIIAEYQ